MPVTDPAELRRQRGLAIAAVSPVLQKQQGFWTVPSQTGNGKYWVRIEGETATCTCEDFEARGQPCKHIYAVQFTMQRESNGAVATAAIAEPVTPTPAITKKTCAVRKTYKQDWPNYNAAQVNEKHKFQVLLAELCRGLPETPRKNGKGRKPIPYVDAVFACVFKAYCLLSSRRFSCDLKDAHERGHLGCLPHFNSVLNYLEDPALTPLLTRLIVQSSLPLHAVEVKFAVDSTGFTTSKFVRWFDHKYGVVKQQHDWVKVSVCTGVKTNVVTAVEIDGRYSGDSPQFIPLVKTTAQGFTLSEVSADAAYLSYENMVAVAGLGGVPYIAFRSNTTASGGGMLEKMFHLYNFNRDEYLDHYHQRSNAESTFSMIKMKFGDGLRSKTDAAMANEALCKVLCHNLCCLISSMYELDVNPVFWGDEPTDGEESPNVIPLRQMVE